MKFVMGCVVGVVVTIIGLGVYTVLSDVLRDRDEGWNRTVSVQKNEKTGVSTVCVHSNPTRFLVKMEGKNPDLMATWQPSDRYYGSEFLVTAAITPKTIVSGVMIAREGEDDAWDGIECTDEAGNRWRCVWLDDENQEMYRKHPDLRMARRYWSGSVTVDPSGQIVFQEDGRPDTPHETSSTWHLVQ